ncbi:uncharacterized protein LOC119783568 [Cyprinodon tularosa]|uniref:uncharacterized protein LOC119783568 n=1 Tax=Cyprinodon tularosa TaxID=77115 RepID=UPI0018E228A1|nr:uncharacterized protein LOC119783568 [Cyprinodon tularosa]
MSQEDEGAGPSGAGRGSDEDSQAAPSLDSGGNPFVQLQTQILELSRKHDAAMSSISNMCNVQTRSVVYIPREKAIVPFCGEAGKDAYTVDEFIDEVGRAMRTRGLHGEDQTDFILSQLKGSALEEVKLRMGGQARQPRDLFSYLREAFREKRTTPQLLHAFYARRQLDGEDLRDYSHALSQLLNSALQQSPGVVPDTQLTLRDQFIEGVRDSTLRRELRRLIREKPDCNLFDNREEALMWTMEDRPRSANVARNRNIVGNRPNDNLEKTDSTINSQTDLAFTLQEVVKIIAQQGKAIGELTNAVRELTTQAASSEDSRSARTKPKPKYTRDGQPICLRCEGVGHMARYCNTQRKPTNQSPGMPGSAVQENGSPPLL